MGELIVSEFVTLDGVMEAPGGEPGHPHSGWVFPHVSEEWEADKHREVEEAGSLLLGRVTYDSHAGAWPQMAGPFADRMNTMRKRVVSRTLTEPEWANTEVIGMDAIDAVASFRREPDEPPMIVVGSHSLVQQLLAADLVDRVRLTVFPVAVGGGLRVFPDDGVRRDFALSDTTRYSNGVTMLDLVRSR